MAKPVCWVELRYGWGLKGVPIGQTVNSELLKQAKVILLSEAERRAEVSRKVDSILGFIQKKELEKLQSILDVLIPKQ